MVDTPGYTVYSLLELMGLAEPLQAAKGLPVISQNSQRVIKNQPMTCQAVDYA